MRVVSMTLEEQNEITPVLASAQAAVKRARASLQALRDLRSNLLAALLSGEHEIPESYDEV